MWIDGYNTTRWLTIDAGGCMWMQYHQLCITDPSADDDRNGVGWGGDRWMACVFVNEHDGHSLNSFLGRSDRQASQKFRMTDRQIDRQTDHWITFDSQLAGRQKKAFDTSKCNSSWTVIFEIARCPPHSPHTTTCNASIIIDQRRANNLQCDG